MGLAIMRGFEIQDTASRVRSVLPEWKPKNSGTRAQTIEDLHRFLKKSMEGYPLEKKIPTGQATADLVIAHQVILEPVLGLQSAKELDALLQRLASLNKWKGVVLAILLGPVKESLRAKLDDYVNSRNNDREFMSVREIIVTRAGLTRASKSSRK